MENQPETTAPESQAPVTPPVSTPKSRLPLIIALGVVLLLLVLASVWAYTRPDTQTTSNTTPAQATATPTATPAAIKITATEKGKLILSGGYADPTVVPIASGYRMYVNRQSGGPGGYLTYTSRDGITWTKEKDIIISGVATGRAIVLPTGIRFYYPGVQPIKATDPQADMYSSFSTDGTAFTKDAGKVLSPRTSGHYVEGPTVFQLPDKTWRMYFNENTVAAGNQRDGAIWGASSADGLTWTRDEALTMEADATENVNKSPWKQVLHPFVLANPKGGYIMLYNSHSELYAATSTDGLTWKKIGYVGIHGADIDGYFQEDGTIRVYYGDFDEKTGGLVYMGILKVE
ncbi:MAG TPA: hypothetical protein VLA04_06750 [Verrucomicrobiae bacterium]|nr:hypothetical protein [Verrucomicrobiae bacterium]